MKRGTVIFGLVCIALVGAGFGGIVLRDAERVAKWSWVPTHGMTVEEVEAHIGQPDSIEHSEATGVTGEVYHYTRYSDLKSDHKIIFVNGQVFADDYGAKS